MVLNLARGCFKHGTVVHEMLHTLSFYHMQSTFDRDDFVTIVWENILPVFYFAYILISRSSLHGVLNSTLDVGIFKYLNKVLLLGIFTKYISLLHGLNTISPNITTILLTLPYDYGSVMHYPEKAFSKNGNKTIIPIQVPCFWYLSGSVRSQGRD
ncbi:zinc metalloproteinase nas-4-like [Anticarsia gemmatalis]|uniref:zinc metalloproteinase nas-4-like n=1 Tax=Anticarsia gemmatalis TaxID=129554 RepID=UPI003F76C94F